MTTQINILSIIGKHTPLLAAAIEHNMPIEVTPKRVKEAIKEIVEAVIDKCAEEANCTQITVEKDIELENIILNIKNLINYE